MSVSNVYGALAEFEDAHAVFAACEKVRDAQYERWDSYTPYPVHGLDKAMGLPRSKLGFMVFWFGICGAAGAMLLQWYVAAVDYPLIISAKPYFSWQAFIPVTFEVMILFSAGSAVILMLFLNRLPQWHHPLLATARFARASDDRFYIAIEAADPKFDAKRTSDFLRSIGAKHVELVEE